jgi:hypothetical protein
MRARHDSIFPGRKRRGLALDFEGILAGGEAEKQDEIAKKGGIFAERSLLRHDPASLADNRINISI